MESFSTQNLLTPWTNQIPATYAGDSPIGYILSKGDSTFTKEITLNGNGGAFTVNIARITGMVDVYEFVMFASLNISNCTGAYLDIYDGTTAVPITEAVTGATLTGTIANSRILLPVSEAGVLTVLNSDQARMGYTAFNQDTPLSLVAKNGTNTYLRFNGITSDTPMTGKISFVTRHKKINGGNIVQP